MHEAQQHLQSRYSLLRDTRTGPVFFIEHGLAEMEVDHLVEDVRSAIGIHPFERAYWDSYPLPLVVVATEVGYRYRGTGTDFWPLLEEGLGSRFGAQARRRIRDLFESAAGAFRGAHPPKTRWAEAFHLIAWPITHALVPREFHRPLALTLASLRENVRDLGDEALYRAIRMAAGNSSARFSTLLESPALVVSVVRSLLGEPTRELSSEAIQRITDDLAADRSAQRSLAIARRVQLEMPSRVTREQHERDSVPPVTGTFQLRIRGNMPSLEAIFPPLDPGLSSRLRNALRRRRFAPRLWGVTTRVPVEQILSGLPFPMQVQEVPPDDAVLLPELEELDIGQDLYRVLDAFQLRLAPPLLFVRGADKRSARLIRGPNVSGDRVYWALTSTPLSSLQTCPVLGEIGPYTCYALDPSVEGQCQALKELGYLPRFGVSVSFAGSPPLGQDLPTPVFIEGDRRFILPKRSCPDGLLVELNGTTILVSDEEVVSVPVSAGEQLLRISCGGESREYTFRGISPPAPSPPTACAITARSTDLTVQALISGTLAFTVDSFAPLGNLDIIVEFEIGATRFGASARLGPLPQTITSKHEPFASLLNEATVELLLQTPGPVLHLRIGNLCSQTWVLEHQVRPCWWVRTSEGEVTLTSEFGELEYGLVSAVEPHLPPTSEPKQPTEEALLLVPMGLDTSEYGPGALFTTLCLAPKVVSLQAPRIRKPRVQRRRRSRGNGVGLEDLVEAFLRWSLAESDSMVAEFRRRQITNEIDGWIAEASCGNIWRDRELALPTQGPWELLKVTAQDRGLGRDSYISLPEQVWREVVEVAIDLIHHDVPGLWSRSRPPGELTDRDWLVVEAACDRAYQTISLRYESIRRTDIVNALSEADASADFDPAAWESAIRGVIAQDELSELASLLLPTNTAPALMALNPTGLSLDDMADELDHWVRESQKAFAGDIPTRETLRTMVALWTDPEVVLNMDWRGALDTMISERSVARATRYLALRHRRARMGGGV